MMMDYEQDEGVVTQWFVLECGDCEHTWEKTMEVTTARYGAVYADYTCPNCNLRFVGEMYGEDWRGWTDN